MPENEKNQGGCHTKRRRDMFQPSFSKAKCELLRPGQSVVLRISPSRKKLGFSVWKQSINASKKQRALMKDSGRWLLFEHLLFVPKHVTLSQKMRLAWLVSIPASCFFDQQALHDKNLKGDVCGFPNWDWKISKKSLSISERCKKSTHHTKWP